MTEKEKSKVMSAAKNEAGMAWDYELDGFPEKVREHMTAFRALMQLAVSLDIATEEDGEKILETAHIESIAFNKWKKERAAQMREEGEL